MGLLVGEHLLAQRGVFGQVLVGVAQVEPDPAVADRLHQLSPAQPVGDAASPGAPVLQIVAHGEDAKPLARIAVQHLGQGVVREHRALVQPMVELKGLAPEGRGLVGRPVGDHGHGAARSAESSWTGSWARAARRRS